MCHVMVVFLPYPNPRTTLSPTKLPRNYNEIYWISGTSIPQPKKKRETDICNNIVSMSGIVFSCPGTNPFILFMFFDSYENI